MPQSPSLLKQELPCSWGEHGWEKHGGGREDDLLRTALLPRILAQGLEIESGGIGKPLILPLAMLVWRKQGD